MNLDALIKSRNACKETKQMKKQADSVRNSIHKGKSKAVELLKSGMQRKQVAKQTKISYETINKYARELSL